MVPFLAVVLPTLVWQGGVNAAPELRKAGITDIAVPSADASQWKAMGGISTHPFDVAGAVKLQAPGVALHIDEASASRVPWVSSNGWRFIRQPGARFYYDVTGNTAPVAAAEAFCFGSQAFIHTDGNGIAPLGKMLAFLRTINSEGEKPVADIGFVDDGSPVSAEVMNLMVRNNLLFEIAPSSGAPDKLAVDIRSKEYAAASVKDADSIVHKIRANLTDSARSVRLFGTSVVIARLTGQPGKLRVHLLNYGAAGRIRAGGFRVHVLGRYSKPQIRSFDTPGEKLLDYEIQSNATEFTVPELKAYAVVDLIR
jgi:hypothetical protein